MGQGCHQGGPELPSPGSALLGALPLPDIIKPSCLLQLCSPTSCKPAPVSILLMRNPKLRDVKLLTSDVPRKGVASGLGSGLFESSFHSMGCQEGSWGRELPGTGTSQKEQAQRPASNGSSRGVRSTGAAWQDHRLSRRGSPVSSLSAWVTRRGGFLELSGFHVYVLSNITSPGLAWS